MRELVLEIEEEVCERLDKYISSLFPDLSRSYIQKLIKEQEILVASEKSGGIPKPIKASVQLAANDQLHIHIPDPEVLDIEPEDIPLDILYEDEDLLFINKPKGMVVHPAPGHYSGTLVNAIMYHCKDQLSGINGVLRPGIVHRIDMNTTGVLVVCKNDEAHQHVAAQLAKHSITREYEAICMNSFGENVSGTVDAPLARAKNDRMKMAIDPMGKRAVTHYEVLTNFSGYAHILCRLETGRTHQIRVHMASIHHPLLGDELYGPKKCPFSLEGQCLHARTLGLIHPRTGEYIEVHAKRPEYFENLLHRFSSI
ncbi:MAG: RluA family pseudouridine synthase [Lachnospiraceae bacterium]|nr:RluA family pseudouridine synthase [Lachnospiraceae bacterium]